MQTPVNGKWFWPESDTQHCGGRSASVATLTFFRTEYNVPANLVEALTIWLSADSRYKLYVNEKLIAVGPAKAVGNQWFMDPVELTGILTTGTNTICIEVLTYNNEAVGNTSVPRMGQPGLFIATTPSFTALSDPSSWKALMAVGTQFMQGINTQFLGIQECVDGSERPHGWLLAGFDDRSWKTPTLDTRQISAQRPKLEPRTIPALTFEPDSFKSVARVGGYPSQWEALLAGGSVTIPAGEITEVDFDASELLTAFLSLEFIGGAGAKLTLVAAEAYEKEPFDLPWSRNKGQRDDPRGQDFFGDADTYELGGFGTADSPETYAPYWFRTFRFLRLIITTSNEPVTIQKLGVQKHNYPIEIAGHFSTSAPGFDKLWDVSIRTLRNCMHETFEDCPFYEQLQYAMDTRSQALFSLHLSQDDRLIRRAIADLAGSGDVHGLTASRAPSVELQTIPNFSLFWIFMINDHLMYVGDKEFTKQFLPRIAAVLDYFGNSRNEAGLVVSRIGDEFWNFVDWTSKWRDSRGVPNLGTRGTNTISTLMYVEALNQASIIASYCDDEISALNYREQAAKTTQAVALSSAWDAELQYFRDSDSGAPESVHAQVWAVLASVVVGEQASDLLERAIADVNLAQCSYAMSLSLFDALQMASVSHLIDWRPWQEMLDSGLTTWAEDALTSRSDCHGWGSVPLQHLPKYTLGIRPLEPGFTKVAIAPAPSELPDAQGTIPTPLGEIAVTWSCISSTGARRFAVTLPAEMTYQLDVNAVDTSVKTEGGLQYVSFTLVK